ncbi:E3 ubiquitin-protein ligase MYLIP [Drosophila guanche]|uniref:RING-type E3 ubiquitin transferase n=1 Tax=Drosophila guanche TaxID=7266 RepID=A0A3B0J2F1_DROGU|nr:E3 ubiquitin-protein ligase MYLIP [Drosophila guanche]SPP73252.1 blast:E3 ubiquitin-protein ligase MYLIP-A [Drosophila guanche]
MWWCIVNLPNGTQQAVKWDPKANGQECLEKVCLALNIICEMEYFGLEHWTPNQKETQTRQWINLRNRLSCDSGSSGSGIQLMLALRVKFWVPVHFILQESVRNLFYMQARRDLLEGRLSASDWSNAAKLAALLCQADGLRFNEAALRADCPMRMRRELAQQQLQQQQAQQQRHEQQRKEKEHVLSFKKRRLSKQKSMEHIENCALPLAATSCSLQPSPSTSTSANTSHTCSSHTHSNSSSSSPSNSSSQTGLDERLASNPLRMYEEYVFLPSHETSGDAASVPEPPADYLRQIATEHGKLAKLQMSPKSAKYWLLQSIQDLPGYGEELFSGVTTNESATRCDIAVGAHGITVCRGGEKQSIPFGAIAAAKSLRRTFKLEYVDDHNDRKELEIKLPKQPIAAGLYRSITERHAFYVCDKVRGVVTNQFTRDLKGTIASMFKEDTELGKRYVFDIQHTCREVHDQARRILHERGGDAAVRAEAADGAVAAAAAAATAVGAGAGSSCGAGGGSMAGKIDLAIREKEAREAAIERCVDTRISEAMQCKICMDRAINTVFNPCCHVIACAQCAARCSNCPNCRVKITSVVKIYLPPELRTSQSECVSGGSNTTNSHSQSQSEVSQEAELQLEEISVATATATATAGGSAAPVAGVAEPGGGQAKVTTAA